MATPPIVTATMQSAFLAALSSILAQTITAYKKDDPLLIDWIPVLQFAIFAIVSTPPNFLWQDFLESTFPAHPAPPPPPQKSKSKSNNNHQPPSSPKLSIRNTITKFLLDQTLGAAFNTLLFSTFTRSLRAAMHNAPRITSPVSAAQYWTRPRAIDFTVVDFTSVWDEAKSEFWPFIAAGLKLWPAVALVNFTLVKSVQGRNLVGALAGVGWGVYVCLVTGE